jgi:HEAT repeat protein
MIRHTILAALALAIAAPAMFAAADAKAPAKLTSGDLDKIWAELGRHDDEGCLQANFEMERLVAAPDLAVPFLRDRLKPAPAVDTSGVAKLVADLDSNDFATRDKAYKTLAVFGSKARPILEKKLEEKELSLELQNSLKRLIDGSQGSEGRGLSADDFRAIRGILVLGEIGSPVAREILEKVAKGDDGSPLTAAAQRNLKLLDQRTKK